MIDDTAKSIRIVLFEREDCGPGGIREWVTRQTWLELLASAGNLSSIPDLCSTFTPDVILIRLETEHLNEAQTVRLIRHQCPRSRVIVVGPDPSGTGDSFDYLDRAIRDLTQGPASQGENFGYVL